MRLIEARLTFLWSMLDGKSRSLLPLSDLSRKIERDYARRVVLTVRLFDMVVNRLMMARRSENHGRLIWVQHEFEIKTGNDNYLYCQRNLTSYFVVVGTVEDCLQRQE